jgi:uncharacterized membrane protein YfcA
MSSSHAALLFLAGLLAGALNAIAGGGGFITLPALMFSGAPPILSNTTGTLAVWPGLAMGLFAYRRNLARRDHPLGLYAVLAVAGGVLGAWLLLFTSNRFFLAMLPWLLLFATLTFIFGGRVTPWIMGLTGEARRPVPAAVTRLLLFLIAVYGGYFGGGMGIMTLATLALLGMRDIHEMNALKSLLVVIINGVGVIVFIAMGKVDWLRFAAMAGGSALGGYAAARLAQKVNPLWVRRFIAAVAMGMTGYYFWVVYAGKR